MKSFLTYTLLLFSIHSFAQNLSIKGLQQPVEVYRDRWGIAHIYAQNEHDLFMAQGYVAAYDRLFQLEIWRRQATGTVAELLGEQELKRDIGSRLFKFRGNLKSELAHYHPHSQQIISAFVEGINARVREVRNQQSLLTFEFKTLKTLPDFWTPEIVISRHQGLLGNVQEELTNARLAHLIGAEKLRELQWFHPTTSSNEPNLDLDKNINGEELFQPILGLYEAFRAPLKFGKEDSRTAFNFDDWYTAEKANVGSNNWVVSGNRTQSGYPMLANDPHRATSVPSLRYMIHLNAPGWNVIGAGEPSLPGVSIGHNEYGAWGLTIFETDNEDLYVYESNPKKVDQYKYMGRWENIKTIIDTIKIKDKQPQIVTLKYTRHGPVVFEDTTHQKIYAVRAGWQEIGCSPYLASLRMNQSKTWNDFRQACMASRIPGENMIWADKQGNIGWQAVGLSPIRKNWSGLMPVAGDGRYEWGGFLPIAQLPNSTNPANGYVITANNNLTPPNFANRNAIGWTWANPVRAHRIEEVINSGKRLNLNDFAQLQTDYLSITARTISPLLKSLTMASDQANQAKELLMNWDYKLTPDAKAATVYVAWENELKKMIHQKMVPQKAQQYLKSISTKRLTDWLITPPPYWGKNPLAARDSLIIQSFDKALASIIERLGENPDDWQYGQANGKHIYLKHTLSNMVDDATRQQINLGPIARGGYAETVNNTGLLLNQTHGASFRILMDTEDWDKTLSINSPGQSSNPNDAHYKDLFELWAKDGYFPLYYSKSKIVANAETIWRMIP